MSSARDGEVGNVERLGEHLVVNDVAEEQAELTRVDVGGSQRRLVEVGARAGVIIVLGVNPAGPEDERPRAVTGRRERGLDRNRCGAAGRAFP